MHTEVKNHNQMEKQNHVYESASSSAPSRCISYMPPALPVVVDFAKLCSESEEQHSIPPSTLAETKDDQNENSAHSWFAQRTVGSTHSGNGW